MHYNHKKVHQFHLQLQQYEDLDFGQVLIHNKNAIQFSFQDRFSVLYDTVNFLRNIMKKFLDQFLKYGDRNSRIHLLFLQTRYHEILENPIVNKVTSYPHICIHIFEIKSAVYATRKSKIPILPFFDSTRDTEFWICSKRFSRLLNHSMDFLSHKYEKTTIMN